MFSWTEGVSELVTRLIPVHQVPLTMMMNIFVAFNFTLYEIFKNTPQVLEKFNNNTAET